jgi:hypothetical protein
MLTILPSRRLSKRVKMSSAEASDLAAAVAVMADGR